MRYKLLPLLLLAILMVIYACQGKKEPEKKETQGKVSTEGFVINFRPNDSLDLIPDNTIILQLSGAEVVGGHPKSINTGKEKDFCVDVLAKGIDSVSRVFFELNYNPGYTDYLSYKPGNLFEQKGVTVYKVGIKENLKGKMEVIISFASETTGISGTGNIVTLCFKALGDGRDDFLFENGELIDSQKEKVTGVNWVGGLLWILKRL